MHVEPLGRERVRADRCACGLHRARRDSAEPDLELLFGRDPNILTTMDELTLIQIQVQVGPVAGDPLWQDNRDLVSGVAKPLQFEVTPMPTHGFVLSEVIDGSGYI